MTEPTLRAGRAAAFLFGALLILPLAIAPATAQPPAAAPPAGSAMEPRIQQLHQMLHITPAQQADFNAFAGAMSSYEATMRSLLQQHPPSANTNAVESLRFAQQLAAAQAEGLGRVIEPFARLYVALSPAQKNTANQIFTAAPATSPRRR